MVVERKQKLFWNQWTKWNILKPCRSWNSNFHQNKNHPTLCIPAQYSCVRFCVYMYLIYLIYLPNVMCLHLCYVMCTHLWIYRTYPIYYIVYTCDICPMLCVRTRSHQSIPATQVIYLATRKRQTEKQTEIICREDKNIPPLPLHPTFDDCFCCFCAVKSQGSFPFFSILPDAEKAPLLNK